MSSVAIQRSMRSAHTQSPEPHGQRVQAARVDIIEAQQAIRASEALAAVSFDTPGSLPDTLVVCRCRSETSRAVRRMLPGAGPSVSLHHEDFNTIRKRASRYVHSARPWLARLSHTSIGHCRPAEAQLRVCTHQDLTYARSGPDLVRCMTQPHICTPKQRACQIKHARSRVATPYTLMYAQYDVPTRAQLLHCQHQRRSYMATRASDASSAWL